MSAETNAFGVYLHWPFCLSKCPYCDFNSHVRHAAIEEARYVRAFEAEIAATAARIPGRTVSTMFFGGGTPSLMQPSTVAAILDAVAKHWSIAPDVEITLEANPTSVEAERFRGYRAAGVNRVSLGVQSLDDRVLKELGRMHSADEALAAVSVARSVFERYSFDLIYARPGQSLAAWEAELEEALTLAGEHLSLYQLTIEAGTAFGNRAARGETLAADEETAATLFEATQRRLEQAGLLAYEISNHARPGAECRHNLAYWRYQDYLGIGPGAHGRISRNGVKLATQQLRVPEAWLAAVESTGDGVEEATPVEHDSAVEEMVMMGLRLAEGVSRRRLETLAGRDVEDLFGAALPRLAEGGFVTLDADTLAATAAGRQRLNAVLGALFAP